MTTGWRIRDGRPDDGAAMLAIHVAAIMAVDQSIYSAELLRSWAHGLTAEGYAASMRDGEEFEIALDGGGRPIAFCGAKNGEVFGLYVHPDAQLSGIGAALLMRGERRARRQRPDADHLPLSASLNAIPFYQKHGYRLMRIESRPSRGGLPMDAACMSKPIDMVAPAESSPRE